jgi:hypothetical protein
MPTLPTTTSRLMAGSGSSKTSLRSKLSLRAASLVKRLVDFIA